MGVRIRNKDYKMKKLFYSLAALMALASCSEGFAISGTVDDRLQIPEGTVVTLLDNKGEEVAQIPVENGKFAYEMPVDVTTCYTLALNTDTYSETVGFIPDNARAKVSFGPVSAAITGSTLSTEFNEICSTVSELTEKAGEEFRRFYEVADEAGASEVEEKYNADMKSVLSEAYSKNTDNYIGLTTLRMLSEYLEYDEAVELYDKGGDIIRNDEDVNEFIDRKKAAHDTSVGCKFVEIMGKNVNGEDIKLSDFVGKGDYVLVDFWASWCGPCMNAIPNARALLHKYASKGFQLVGVNCWERREGAGQAKAAEMEMTWPVIFAEESAPAAYGVEAIPTLILFGPDGTIVERLLGETGLNEAVARHFEN